MNQTLELIFHKTISVKCLDEPNTGIDFLENNFWDSQTAENIFLFWKLAFLENMYFPENNLQQPNAPLINNEKTLAMQLVRQRGKAIFSKLN